MLTQNTAKLFIINYFTQKAEQSYWKGLVTEHCWLFGSMQNLKTVNNIVHLTTMIICCSNERSIATLTRQIEEQEQGARVAQSVSAWPWCIRSQVRSLDLTSLFQLLSFQCSLSACSFKYPYLTEHWWKEGGKMSAPSASWENTL